MIGAITVTYGSGAWFSSLSYVDPATSSITGCMFGSLLGGRWSDYKLVKLKEANEGNFHPEVSNPRVGRNGEFNQLTR